MPGDEPFYYRLAEFYGLLFPATEQQRRFFSDLVRQYGVRRALDVACGSGEQAAMFRDLGLEVSALENDPRMVELTRRKGGGIRVRVGSMERLADLFEPGFDLVVCIGNSLPHLLDLDSVQRAIGDMCSLLRPGGVLVLSIVNYDWVAREAVTELPAKRVTDAQGRQVVFERDYDLSGLPDEVIFSTRLTVSGEAYSGSVRLIPISPETLTSAVAQAGTRVVGQYEGFDGKPFRPDSQSLVLVAQAL